eukprot:TRINITY_DN5419_c0_g1_i1.p1 TRINITY_DN5419_c0_g1~~TRINITY_DN5419_c0_g1_i1.p1  ORF type:complete len:1199 (+),score=211.24 TRINITY_DN5419_c0_g1_i1:355-3597(+)
MAQHSPLGVVGFRFKLWSESSIVGRRWVGRTLPAAVPGRCKCFRLGEVDMRAACLGGSAADLARQLASVVADASQLLRPCMKSQLEQLGWQGQAASSAASAKAHGKAALEAVQRAQWPAAAALLSDISLAGAELRQRALRQVDSAGRSVLRHCVDRTQEPLPSCLQALEDALLSVVIGCRRPYWWKLRITAVSAATSSFVGESYVGIPKLTGMSAASSVASHTWTAPSGVPCWDDISWSEKEACRGELCLKSDAAGEEFALLKSDDMDLVLSLVPSGKVMKFAAGKLRNPLVEPLLVASGQVAGASASGTFDPISCARLAIMRRTKADGPCEVAATALGCGADPHGLADDGLSPYTAAILGQDPCNLLSGLDPQLRLRIRRGDPNGWAEAGRAYAGLGRPDLVAAPLARGQPVPDDLVQELLDHCFQANLPVLAWRVLQRVDGQKHLLAALENAEDPQWLRVAERMIQQRQRHEQASLGPASGGTDWCSESTIKYALEQARNGRRQFRLLLQTYFDRLHHMERDFFIDPASLPDGGAECPVCFEPLCRKSVLAFAQDGKVVCQHYLCGPCAKSLQAASSSSSAAIGLRCPECRRDATSVKEMPCMLQAPLEWLDFVCGDSETKVSQQALLRALAAMLPMDADELFAAVDRGTIPGGPLHAEVLVGDFLTRGLHSWVWKQLFEHRRFRACASPPSLADRGAWFKYWDLTNSGYLKKAEVLRATLRSCQISSLDKERVEDFRQKITSAWDRYVMLQAKKHGHCSASAVSEEEFAEEGGLGDSLEEAFIGQTALLGAQDAQMAKPLRQRFDRQRQARRAKRGGARRSDDAPATDEAMVEDEGSLQMPSRVSASEGYESQGAASPEPREDVEAASEEDEAGMPAMWAQPREERRPLSAAGSHSRPVMLPSSVPDEPVTPVDAAQPLVLIEEPVLVPPLGDEPADSTEDFELNGEMFVLPLTNDTGDASSGDETLTPYAAPWQDVGPYLPPEDDTSPLDVFTMGSTSDFMSLITTGARRFMESIGASDMAAALSPVQGDSGLSTGAATGQDSTAPSEQEQEQSTEEVAYPVEALEIAPGTQILRL